MRTSLGVIQNAALNIILLYCILKTVERKHLFVLFVFAVCFLILDLKYLQK